MQIKTKGRPVEVRTRLTELYADLRLVEKKIKRTKFNDFGAQGGLLNLKHLLEESIKYIERKIV